MNDMRTRRGVVIVAGGSGSRMGGEIPKQYLKLAGKPIIVHTLERFFEFDPEMNVVVVLSSGHEKHWDGIALPAGFRSAIALARGGMTRYDSVKSGLLLMEDAEIVGIHDAVRPLVSLDTLERCYASAALNGSGIPVTEMDETVRILRNEDHSEHLDRSLLRRVQTPQVFQAERIRNAYNLPYDPAFTDDASVYESLYGEVNLVAGNQENIKITTPTDLMLASLLIKS
jgi:2-C-methyl-D-erythritol 4-phosphate cytidylyltransferase